VLELRVAVSLDENAAVLDRAKGTKSKGIITSSLISLVAQLTPSGK
jgi:hypothetical protein